MEEKMNFNTLFLQYLYSVAFLIFIIFLMLIVVTIFKIENKWFDRLFFFIIYLIATILTIFICHWVILNKGEIWNKILSSF